MGGNDGDDAASPKYESSSLGLVDGIRGFALYLRGILINQGVLSHPSAYNTAKKLLGFAQRWECFAIMPIDHLKVERIEQGEINIVSV